ncbi:P2Y purinoceptor 2-like [Bufo gargarizans]|uniref:P2Y purinoceptor 2-like n=1 Tax=Bufo gargarizans TaxID=30331 RepID=UPI001CF1A4D0|nr:P2Y purinoceptor 2-like [Bufo gargarizans]XP_044129929.1 P2Y purinoceptor 2-like [Bufo gargarizans]XP_044129930.1 P2Y purinoceptor 2-like [Bufo gargarizans]XP_044129931.1 P2Y purinoceptor 2-like [Bufo gargarizans]XP_044129932.1 P2Y purinoceptor 2-like [Bufo gargarizans]XP_044129933.1 P2Y purinoceptor 2-like [Bufo gargarizans]XP_044129934.1 P2Y purinoceptor 2-like [Bufo gargarizans]XP_044129935.1 P2Y purinoceptor 2-like [Bufo gargarizans]XP_044129936.1 P2Y purinoceptor 2-like [Bufo gargar
MDDDPEEKNLTYRCIFDEDFKYILLPASYAIVFAFGFILNIFSLYIFIFRIRPWKVVNIFMFNLALSDFLYTLSLPLLAYYYSKANDWPFTEPLCKIVRFLFYTSMYCSILFLLCITIYRFLAVCYPIQFLRWGHIRYARIASVCIWFVVVVMQSPTFYFVTTSRNDGSTVCHDTSSIELFDQFVNYNTVNLALLFCVPFTILISCNSYMIYVLTKPIENNSQNTKSKRKSIKMIITVMLVFIMCFLPFHVTRTMYYYFRKVDTAPCPTLEAVNVAYKSMRPLASANSCIDPILYFLVWRFRLRPNSS